MHGMSKHRERAEAALDRVIVKAGGQSRLARALGVRRQAVHQWTRIPRRHLEAVAALTGYRIGGLRPDIVARRKMAGRESLPISQPSAAGEGVV